MCMHTSHRPYACLPRTLRSWQRTNGNPWCVVHDTFVAIVRDVGFHVGREQLHVLLSIMFQLLSSSLSWHCAHQKWHPHFNQQCHCPPNASGFTSLILCNSRICNPWHDSSQRKELSQLTPHWSIPPFNNWCIWVSIQASWYVFTQLWQYHLELEKIKRP
jgi:hypothetical protein